ncbi:MAG TPA: hypothetical protein VG938_02420 [Verrucomicrobiae bacterium]|jgi:hypothetical protein|nr:hypothetical protein [Verrucomicrobiae bacterium]
MKSRILSFLTVGVLAGSGLMAQAVDTAPVQASATVTVPSPSAPEFSGRINDIVALSRSGVDQSVVLSYIKTSPGPFQPSADEIIRLRDAGLTTDELTTMLQRGAELREQAQVASAQAYAASTQYAQSSPAYAQQAPATVVTPPATYVDPTYNPYYTQPASSVVYIGGSYGYPYLNSGYCYPYYYSSYPYYYSRGYYPRVGFGFGFNNFGHFGGGFHAVGGFHGGFSGGFHSGGGFHGGGGFHASGGGFHGGGHR